MAYRLVCGRLLATTVLGDAACGLSELIAPRPLLMLSATEDRYSADMPEIVQAARSAWKAHDVCEGLQHVRCKGGHALTPDRKQRIVSWLLDLCVSLREQEP
jgi:hypothetical protein